MNLKSRKHDLAVQESNGELFIYDLKTDQMYSLNPTSTFVWNQLDGETSVEELACKISEQFNHPVSEDFVWLAIDGLRSSNLLEKEGLPKAMSKLKRREAVKRIGLATMIALPVISMLVAPTALNAASGIAAVCQPCTGDTGTQGNCAPGSFCKNTPGSKICGANSNQANTLESGNSGYSYTIGDCNSRGSRYCCTGTATFSNYSCTCD